MWCKPVSASASISLILSAVPIGPGSIWKPSRGPSSWISTCFGRSVMSFSFAGPGRNAGGPDNLCGRMGADERAARLDGAQPGFQLGVEQVPDMDHLRPDLQLGIDAGRAGDPREPDCIVE